MATSWSSTKYNLFEQQRQQPAVDLLTRGSQLKQDPTRILDLGCGCGNMLPLFLSRFPNASYTGVDNSANMLAQAREVATNGREVNFLERSFQDLSLVDGPVDFLYSNAALHWLDSHESLFPHLLSDDVLVPGGVVCIQVPDTRQMRSHSLAREVASDLGFSPLLKDVHLAHIHHDPEWYYDLLSPLTDTLELWSTTYTQILEGSNPVPHYPRSTYLLSFVQALGGEGSDKFQLFWTRYQEEVEKAYPPQSDGRTLFPFKRFFIVARKKQ